MGKKNRGNERTNKYLKESEDRFLEFWEKCKLLSLGTHNYINKSLEVFAETTGRLEGLLFFELVKERILERDITYEELASEIDKLYIDRKLKPGEHMYNESHLRVAIKRRNYNSIVVDDIKKVLKIKDENIKKEFLQRGNDNIDYLRYAFIALDKVTQEIFLELADRLYYMEKHIDFMDSADDISDIGMYSVEKAREVLHDKSMREGKKV